MYNCMHGILLKQDKTTPDSAHFGPLAQKRVHGNARDPSGFLLSVFINPPSANSPSSVLSAVLYLSANGNVGAAINSGKAKPTCTLSFFSCESEGLGFRKVFLLTGATTGARSGDCAMPQAELSYARAGKAEGIETRMSAHVLGFSLRFPESASPSAFWAHLLSGDDMQTADSRRWPVGLYDTPHRTGKVPDYHLFDNAFFSVHGKQAQRMDPQQRKLLEVVPHRSPFT